MLHNNRELKAIAGILYKNDLNIFWRMPDIKRP